MRGERAGKAHASAGPALTYSASSPRELCIYSNTQFQTAPIPRVGGWKTAEGDKLEQTSWPIHHRRSPSPILSPHQSVLHGAVQLAVCSSVMPAPQYYDRPLMHCQNTYGPVLPVLVTSCPLHPTPPPQESGIMDKWPPLADNPLPNLPQLGTRLLMPLDINGPLSLYQFKNVVPVCCR